MVQYYFGINLKKISFLIRLCIVLVMCFTMGKGWGQVSITSFATPVTQNFDGMGSGATAALPAGFKISAGASPNWATGTTATTQAGGTSGAGALTGSSTGGTYNFANGVTASSMDRALGFLNSSSGFTSPQSIILAVNNTTGLTIQSLTIKFDYEKYRTGTRQFDWTFFHGNMSTPSISNTSGDQSYPADMVVNGVVNPPTATSKTVSLTGLNIPDNTTYYIRWTLTGLGGSSNGQGIGIDNFNITGYITSAFIDAMPDVITNLNYSGTGPSSPASFVLTESGTTNSMTVTAPANFEVATASGGPYSSSLTGITTGATIWVRTIAALTPNAYTGNVTITATGALTKAVAVSGTVTTTACTPSITNTCDEYIKNVTLNTINNSSGCATNGAGYSNYTTITTPVIKGQNYSLSINVGQTADPNSGYSIDDIRVWADWNQDGQFTDATENLISINNNGGAGSYNFTVPTTATLGNVPLRIRLVRDDEPSSCGVSTYGETEDYVLVVSDACVSTVTVSGIYPSTGPANTLVKIIGAGFTGATAVTFNSIAATSFTIISATEIDAKVPAGAGTGPIKITDNTGCSYSTSNFTSTSQTGTCPAGPGSNTDLMITEISDPEVGNNHYIEVYNGTSSVITLNGKYSLQVYNDPSTTTTINLTGTIGINTVKVYYAGSNGGLANGTPLGLPNGFNENDEIRLIKNGSVLDRVKTPTTPGYNYKRVNTIILPNPSYSAAEWIITSPEHTQDVSNIGIYTTNPGYTITGNPVDISSCSINMTVTASPTTGLTYQWKYQNGNTGAGWTALVDGTTSLPGATVSGSASTSLAITGDLTLYDGYQFYVEVINGTCTKSSNAAKFTLGATRYFKSNSPVIGNWTSASSWLMSTSPTGPVWSPTCTYPTAANSDYISIESGDVITLDASNLTLDQVIIQNGGYMKVPPTVTLTIGNGAAGSDFNVLGTLEDGENSANSVVFNTGATWSLGSAGNFIKTNAGSSNNWQGAYETGVANIPATANWILRYTGASMNISFSSVAAYYPNLTFESTSGNWTPSALVKFTGSSGFTTVKGKLDIGGTGSGVVTNLINENTNAQPVLIMDSLIVRAGSGLTNAGTTNGTGFEVRGNLYVQGTLTVNSGATGILKLSGTLPQNISGAGIINLQNFTVTNAAGVNILRNLTVGGTATLTQGIVNPKTNILSLANNIILGSGKIDGDSATLNMTGIVPQTIPANTLVLNNLLNFIISNSDAATGVTLAGALDIYGSLTYSVNNSILNTNNSLTLKSGISQTAWIGDMTNHTINGNVTVERYIATGPTGGNNHTKSWQLLSIPTSGPNYTDGQSIKAAWQEGATASDVIATQTITSDPKPNYGVMLTSDVANATNQPTPGYDAYTPLPGGPSIKTYNSLNSRYDSVFSTSLPIYDKRGYFLFVRGDRSVYTFGGSAVPTTLRTAGRLFTPVQHPPEITSIADNSFESIGNPYASPIDMTKISATGGSVNQYFYVWDPRVGGSYNYGAFVTFQFDGANYIVQTNGGKTYPANGTMYNYIQSGQAFFMHATGGTGMVKFPETAKAGATFSGTIATRHVNENAIPTTAHGNIEKNLRISLQAFDTDGSIVTQDEVLSQFGDYNNGVDGMDAIKQMNTGENISIKTDDKLLVIEKRRAPKLKDTIFLNVTHLRTQKYQLRLDAENLGIVHEGFVEDLYTNTRSPLKFNGNTLVEFTVDGNPGSYSSDRFRIVFSHRKLLPSIYTFLKAYKLDKNINVEWKVNNEHDIQQYEVEKSIDGIHFTSLMLKNPSNNNGNSADYVVIDNKPVNGFNYYRIKIINFDESANFTTIVKEKISFIEKDIEITPNPITNNQIQIRFINESAGIYSLKLLNSLGQDILQKQITRQDGNSTETIKLRPNLAHELYKLEIVKPDGTLKILNVLY